MKDPADDASASANGAPGNGGLTKAAEGARRIDQNVPGGESRNAKTAVDTPSQGEDGHRRSQTDGPESRPDVHGTSPERSGKRRRRRRKRRRKTNLGDLRPHENGAVPQTAASKGKDSSAQDNEKRRERAVDGRNDGKFRNARDASQIGRDRNGFHKSRRYAANSPLYAALDLGTNNCRLLVALPTRPGQFRVVDAFSRIVRLGEGLATSGRLSEAAMDRAVDALKICAAKLQSRTVRRHRLIATEACRSAVNGSEFLERVKAETGLDLEIVDRETEARLAVSGCSSLVGRGTNGVVLFDIGGGSSEIAAIDLSGSRSNRLANHIAAWTSLPVGVVNLSERHGGRHVTDQIFAAMVEEVSGLLGDFACPDMPGLNGSGDGMFHLLGTSGTVTTLAGVHLDLPRYDRQRVDGLWMSSRDVDRMTAKLLSWDFQARSSNPCIGNDRADLVLAGCAILEAIRRRWPSERLRVADRGLREGLLTEMMAADGVWRRGRGRRNHHQMKQSTRRGDLREGRQNPKGENR